MEANQLRAAIRDLTEIDAQHRLSELVTDWANESRRAGLVTPDGDLYQPDADFAADTVAKTAAQLFDLPLAECTRMAREVLREHPRRDIALELIDEFRGRPAAEPKPATTPPRKGRKW